MTLWPTIMDFECLTLNFKVLVNFSVANQQHLHISFPFASILARLEQEYLSRHKWQVMAETLILPASPPASILMATFMVSPNKL